MNPKEFTLSIDTGLLNFGLSILESDSGAVYYMDTIKPEIRTQKGYKSSIQIAKIQSVLNQIKKVVGKYALTQICTERPNSLVAKSSSGTVSITIGITIAIALSELLNIPIAWVTQREVKEIFTGNPNADKKEIMSKCCELYGWDISYHQIKDNTQPSGIRSDPKYNVMGKEIGAGYFEHIADSIAIFHVYKKLKG